MTQTNRKPSKLHDKLYSLRANEDGTASVDGIIWIMFFVTLLVFMVDASIMFMNNIHVRRVAQDGNRLYVLGGFDEQDDAETALEEWIETTLVNISPNLEATVTVDSSTDRVTTVASYPASDTDLSGFVDVLTGFNIQVVVVNQKVDL